MMQSPKRKRIPSIATTPTRPEKVHKDHQPPAYPQVEDDDFDLNTHTTSHFHENISSGMMNSPFLTKINNSGSTLLSGKTSAACSFYSQDDHHSTIKYDTPYTQTPDLTSTEVILDHSFVSELSSPRSPPNFVRGDKISPVRPRSEMINVPYPSLTSSSSSSSNNAPIYQSPLHAQIDRESYEMYSPAILPQPSSSPKFDRERRKKEKSYTERSIDVFGIEIGHDIEYSSSCSSSGELNLSHPDFPINTSHSFHSSTSVLQNDSESLEYDSLPSSANCTLFLEDFHHHNSPAPPPLSAAAAAAAGRSAKKNNKNKNNITNNNDDDRCISGTKHQRSPTADQAYPTSTSSSSSSSSSSHPDKFMTNQHKDRLEDKTSTCTSTTKIRNRSLPPSYARDNPDFDLDESSLVRTQSLNRVLAPTATPFKPPKKRGDISSHKQNKQNNSSTPDLLRTSTSPNIHLQLPHNMMHSPPPSTDSSSMILHGLAFNSPLVREKTPIEQWSGCKSLYAAEENLDGHLPLNPPHSGTTPLRLVKSNNPHPNSENPLARTSSGNSLLHSSESNNGKRSRSPYSSIPSPTEMHFSQHQKIEPNTPQSPTPCPTSTTTSGSNHISLPLPDQSGFESLRYFDSPPCPEIPEKQFLRSHYELSSSHDFENETQPHYEEKQMQKQKGDGENKGENENEDDDDNIFILRTNDSIDEMPTPRIFRQNSLEENKVLISSHPLSNSYQEILNEISESQETSTSSWSASYSFENPESILFYRDFINEGVMGAGTFAVVYRVSLQSDPTQKYAIKKGKKKFKNKSERENLLNEVRIMQTIGEASTSCPYILKFYNAWQEDSYFYVQLELAERGSLRDLMNLYADKNTPLPTPDLLQIFFQIASGLQHIHSCHIVHLDIKPQNILITVDGILKICDFGIAVVEGPNGDERNEGDSKYLPEELLNSRDRYSSADIFSLGLSILDVCLVPQLDTLPYDGRLWHEIRAGLIPDITLLQYGQRPKKLYNLILQCISSSPSRRPSAEKILSNRLFHSNYFTSSTNILRESPIRAPSPLVVYNNPHENIEENETKVSTPIAATPTSGWKQRMFFPSPSSPSPVHGIDSTSYTPFTHRPYPSNQFLNDLTFTEENNSPTSFSLAQFYKTTPREFTPDETNEEEIIRSTQFNRSLHPPATPQSTSRFPQSISKLRLSTPMGPPTSSPELVTTPTSSSSRIHSTQQPPPPPPSTMKSTRKTTTRAPRKK